MTEQILTDHIYQGDALEVLRTLPSESVQMCVTSPPYFGLRDYGTVGQIGLEETPEAFIAKLVAVFAEVKRVLKADGTLWVNIGDSYAGSWGSQGRDYNGIPSEYLSNRQIAASARKQSKTGAIPKGSSLKPKDLIGIPWMLAFALRSDGWYLRMDNIWHKPNPMPESVTDRPTKAHEYVFFLTKSPRYYYNKADGYGDRRKSGKEWKPRQAGSGITPEKRDTVGSESMTANKKSVWTVATHPFSEAHFATFPEKLISPCILAGSREGDAVLDPFFGAGTTGVVCKKLNRRYVGIELNPDYIKIATKRINNVPESLFHQAA